MDDATLEALYRQYHAAALLYALSLCQNAAEAEDLVADAFVKAWVSLDRSHPTFQYWLYRVIRNLWIDRVRRERRRPGLVPREMPTPEEKVLADERSRALWRALETLGPTDREVVILHYFAGLPLGEIAGMFGKTPGAVKTKVCRLRQILKREMEEQGYGF